MKDVKRKVVQVGILVKDLQSSVEKCWNVWRIGPWDIHTLNSRTVREFTVWSKPINEFEYKVAVTRVGDIQIELMQPIRGPNIYWEFLEKKGEGLHHIKEKVEDDRINGALKEFKEKGIDVIQSGRFGEDVFYYLDTESILGFILEIGNDGKVPPPERCYPPNF